MVTSQKVIHSRITNLWPLIIEAIEKVKASGMGIIRKVKNQRKTATPFVSKRSIKIEEMRKAFQGRARNYVFGYVAETWSKHTPVFDILMGFLVDNELEDITTISSLNLWLDHLKGLGALKWKKTKISNYRVATEHWMNCTTLDHRVRDSPIWKRAFGGLWYQKKNGINRPRPEDKGTTKGDMAPKEWEQLKSYINSEGTCLGYDPEDVMEFARTAFASCGRVNEMINAPVGGYTENMRILMVNSCKKGTLDRNTPVEELYSQNIAILDDDVHHMLVERNERLKERVDEPKEADRLLFEHADIPVKKMNLIIQACSEQCGWPQTLKWGTHSFRHGGAQASLALYEASQGTSGEITMAQLRSNLHMSDETYNTCYGLSREARLNTAWARHVNAQLRIPVKKKDRNGQKAIILTKVRAKAMSTAQEKALASKVRSDSGNGNSAKRGKRGRN